jgi:hypothetical protein
MVNFAISGKDWVGGWVGPETDLNVVEKRQISFPYPESVTQPLAWSLY